MKRLFLFLGALSWGARLQLLALILILVRDALIDFQMNRSQVTVSIILISWFIGWLVKPLMIARPKLTSRVGSAIGIVVFAFFLLTLGHRIWRLRIAHYGFELFLWLSLSCEYWFVSELKLREQQFSGEGDFEAPKDDFGDERA